MGWEYRLFFRRFGGSDGDEDEKEKEKEEDTALSQSTSNTKKQEGMSIVGILNENHNLLPYIHKEDPRIDIYIPHSADVGIKYRNVVDTSVDTVTRTGSPRRLEVKLCSSRRDEDSGFERWTKYVVVDNELSNLLKSYGHEVEITQQQLALHKTRRWGQTRNGLVFVEETQLHVRRHNSHHYHHQNSKTPGSIISKQRRRQEEEAKEEVEYWTTVSIEGNSVQPCLKVKDIVQDLCRSYAKEHGDGIIFECGYPEFVQKIAFGSTKTTTT